MKKMSRNSYESEYWGRPACSRCGEYHRHNEPCADLDPDRRKGCVAIAIGAVAVIAVVGLFLTLSSCSDADSRRLPQADRVPEHVHSPRNFH